MQSGDCIDEQKQLPSLEMTGHNPNLPAPPGIPNTKQVGRGRSTATLTDSFIEEEDSERDVDVSTAVSCRYCGILFDDWDNLQKHLSYGCVYEKGQQRCPSKGTIE